MAKARGALLSFLLAAAGVGLAEPARGQLAATVQPGQFVGTWVGTQGWAIADPPPGARADQPVSLEIELVDGRLAGTMRPFLGGEDGATIVEAALIGNELHARAVVGRPRPAGTAARRSGQPGNWKDAIEIRYVFRLDGVDLAGTADVRMGEVPWLAFSYSLSRKRSRY